ncbi:hypothetical protein B0A48_10775 [Cryoendolithus antarcticus]|uniref:Uncharacterized protein n=1 Tax=Cryoendolithus antarcticus TaxID=1507870 RepID=A0A1V8SYC9_9PEZI|nr:hypothetical protein B0A48_10775 [Cryoendolithus antarcticus]
MAPLVTFLLPSIAFSTTIPRRKLFVPTWNLGKGRWSPVRSPLLLLLLSIDMALWVAVIFATAGPLIISAFTEMMLDINIYSILSSGNRVGLSAASRARLLLAIASGNLKQRVEDETITATEHSSFEPLSEISEAIQGLKAEHRPQKLLNLMDAQADWTTTVGYPMAIFFFGFVWASRDLQRAPPSADAPLSLTFGVQWMIVVHVATVSSCLLSNNNPSTASNLVDGPLVPESRALLPDVHESRYQSVSIWNRGSNKHTWLEQITHHCDNGATTQTTGTPCPHVQEHAMLRAVRQDLKIGMWQYLFAILLPAISLTALPYMAGAYLTYQTPPKGFGCLSLTLACYAGSQILVIIFHELKRHAPKPRNSVISVPASASRQSFMRRLRSDIAHVGPRVYRAGVFWVYLAACLISLLVALGEPIMSAAGFYNDCRCFVNVNMWLHIDRAFVPVTFDYSSSPTSYGGWVIMGYAAATFLAVCTLASWCYQRSMKESYSRLVRAPGYRRISR